MARQVSTVDTDHMAQMLPQEDLLERTPHRENTEWRLNTCDRSRLDIATYYDASCPCPASHRPSGTQPTSAGRVSCCHRPPPCGSTVWELSLQPL
jgi:hypothetical protein